MRRRVRFGVLLVLVMTMLSLAVMPAGAVGTNLVTNGDFESGNVGFSTDYTYVAATGWSTLQPPFVYAIGTNPYDYHSAWGPGFGDHTSGSGKMMIVNGTTSTDIPQKLVWGQEVTLPECDDESSYPLYAGQDMLVGDVIVKSDGDKVCVKFVLNAEAMAAGWKMSEVHVAVADSVAGIKQKNGNPIPGQFPVNVSLDPNVTETEWFCFDRDPSWTDPLAIAAHAVVRKSECVVNAQAPYGPDEVVDTVQGRRYDYTAVRAERSNPAAALVFEGNVPGAESDFYSLGFREDRVGMTPIDDSYLVVRFNTPVMNGVGSDLRIVEDTWGLPYPDETCAVYASADGVSWTYLGEASNQTPYDAIHTISDFDLGSLASASYVKVQDTSVRSDFLLKYQQGQGSTLDGFDVNAVISLQDNTKCTEYSETAWGGTSDFSGKNWATYIDYTPKVCSTDYTFRMFAASSYHTNPAQLQVSINGTVVGQLNLTSTKGQWVEFSVPWDAGSATSALIAVRDLRVAYDGDDFVIDDISLVKD